MKYCSNCGEQIDEKAVICVKCGVPVNSNNVTTTTYNSQPISNVPKQGHGAATASLVLGILGVIAAVITLIISIVLASYYSVSWEAQLYGYVSDAYTTEKIMTSIFVSVVPGILSLIGLPLGLFCRKGGPKIAGIVLNAIALVICIVQVVIIMSL